MRRAILILPALALLAACHHRPQSSPVPPYVPAANRQVPPIAVPGDTPAQRKQRIKVWCDGLPNPDAYLMCRCYVADKPAASCPS